jgi:UDPglucose 6-dehydrogenase
MKLAIIGYDTLAATTRKCCEGHFELATAYEAEVIWICHDTPIGIDGAPDWQWILATIGDDVGAITDSKCIVVSSQIPVGTIRTLAGIHPRHRWVYSPENIRVASALADFRYQSRVVVGRCVDDDDELLLRLFNPFTDHIIFTDPETAEMVKHALNCWLGMNIAFINEIARICESVGAYVDMVSEALRTDERIGKRAPLRAGDPFGGGHLSRDIVVLNRLCQARGIRTPIIDSILTSNQAHAASQPLRMNSCSPDSKTSSGNGAL